DANAAKSQLNETVSLIDKMAAKGVIHDNAAGRYKSRIAKRLNALASAYAPRAPVPRRPTAASARTVPPPAVRARPAAALPTPPRHRRGTPHARRQAPVTGRPAASSRGPTTRADRAP